MDEPHFEIHPSVVLKLGEELIADEFTAIAEAAKNAYDAGATKIEIRVDTEATPDPHLASRYPGAKGTISISDDGDGMDAKVISASWLMISYSRKKDLKREAELGKRKLRRVPLGDKGIGRLGLQRLGANVEVFTSTGADNGHHVAFQWADFEKTQRLSDVPVLIEPSTRKLRKGTVILVSGLKSPELWKGTAGRDRLQSKLSQMVSPFDHLRECEVRATLNGTSLDLAQFSKKVLSVADLRFGFEFDGDKLTIEGEYALSYFQLAAEGKPNVAASMDQDDGKRLLEFLVARSGPAKGDLSLGSKATSRLKARRSIVLSSLGEVALAGKEPASPGPFSGEFFHFDRRERASGFDRAGDFKNFLDTQRGIRVYRNGFVFGRYGVDGMDWLGLGDTWSEGTSYYGLKPTNILGYISISAAENPQLVEKTDREGLTDSPAAKNFIRLILEVTNYANLVNAHVRRGLLGFAEELALENAGEVELDLETVTRRLGSARTVAKRVKSAIQGPNREATASEAEVEEFTRAISIAEAMSAEVERIKTENRSLLELAGLGLTAEALSHEIANIADQLAIRVKALTPLLTKPETDRKVVEFAEHVRGATSGLRKQLAHLAPALRFARERKERIDVREFATSQEEYFRERLKAKNISMKVDLGSGPFEVRTSRGKLTQIFDNIVLNSEYWLGEEVRRDSDVQGAIKVRLRPPHLLISDTGPGLDPSIELRLFQPFVTLKPKGRGLGLFIVRQLLDSLGCSVTLKPERNEAGRRYIFDIDLSGVADGDENGS